jgi:hypothetical protein
MNTITKKLFIQAEKYTWDNEFKVVVNSYHNKSDSSTIVIDIEEVDVDVVIPSFTQEQFTNGHIEQLRKVKEKLKADTFIQMQSLDEQIESLLAIESK